MPRSKTIQPDRDSIALEYNALRNEILKRIELRQQLMAITLTLAGVFLSIGITTDTVALVYPPLAAFLAIAWAQDDYRIREIAEYIREHLEACSTGLHYETNIQKMIRTSPKPAMWRSVVISHQGIVIFTQLMAVGIELIRYTPIVLTPIKWVLLAVDLVSILVALLVARDTGPILHRPGASSAGSTDSSI